MKLKNKTALITGSTSGIGKAIAVLFAKEGANIILHGSENSRDAGELLLKELKQLGSAAIHCTADLTKPDEIEKMFHQIKETYGQLDILINNAGRTWNIPFSDITPESLEKDLHINFNSVVLCSQQAVKLMKSNGWIINTSSIRGWDYAGRPGIIGYCSAKAAVNSFTKTLAAEMAPRGIFVNAVAPGFVATENIKLSSAGNPEKMKEWLSNIPIGKFIEPEEIAETYLFLATQKIFCGSILTPDGGYSILNR